MQFKKTVLSNGLRVITVPMPDSATSTVLVLVEAGSEYETKEINGLSHFLEHMCFKGTTRRPTALTIAHELDMLGASFNAFTSTDHTGYYAKAINSNFPQILDLISDLYLNPIFEVAEIEKERGVIIEELNMYEDLPMEKVHSILQNSMYGDQPAGWDIGGTKEVITKLNREDFIKYRSERYIAENTVVVVAGGVDEKETIEAVDKAFNKMVVGKRISKLATVISDSGPRVSIKAKPLDQAHIALGFKAYDISNPRRFALEVLSTYLGEGMSSRLFTVVREELGAAYRISSGVNLGLDHGEFIISAGLNLQKLSVVLQAVFKECKALRDNPLPADKLDETKRKLIGKFPVNLDTSDALAAYFGSQEVDSGEVMTIEEETKKYLAVTAEEVQKAASEVFRNNNLSLAVVSPMENGEALQPLLSVE